MEREWEIWRYDDEWTMLAPAWRESHDSMVDYLNDWHPTRQAAETALLAALKAKGKL